MIVRLPEPVEVVDVVDVDANEDTDCVDEYEEYMDGETSERFERADWARCRMPSSPTVCVCVSDGDSGPISIDARERAALSLICGGTSWSWRLSGWLDTEGGGRTTMNVLRTEPF